MKSALIHIKRTTWMLALLIFVVSCQESIPKRSTIIKGSSLGGDDVICGEDQELISEKIAATDTTPETIIETCKDKAAIRPDGAVFWKSGFCACKDTKPVTSGNCSSFCADKNTNGAETLFASFNVTEKISLSELGNVHGWCKKNISTDGQNSDCEIQAKDDVGNIISIPVTVAANSNSATANIQDKLSNDKTYVLTLVEVTSGAKSDSIQIIKFSPDISLSLLGPLKNVPVSQYSCLIREFSEDSITGDIYYDSAYRLHFYFIPRIPPKPITPGNSNLVCHDIFNPLYGKVDDELYPRFERTQGVFNLWDTTDPRFYDNDGNGAIDINEAIIQKTRNFGGTLSSSAKFFTAFQWPGSPELESDAGNNTSAAQPLGYFMAPWVDNTTFKSYCLTTAHYNSSNPLFKAMRDYIGVDTEGLYVGEKAPETVTDNTGKVTSGYSDYILIRETDLKAVWFYLKDDVPTVPTDNNVANNPIYFYYPLNKASPFVKTSTQRVFRVRGAAELNNTSSESAGTGSTPTGGTTKYPPHDRKIGCIPKF